MVAFGGDVGKSEGWIGLVKVYFPFFPSTKRTCLETAEGWEKGREEGGREGELEFPDRSRGTRSGAFGDRSVELVLKEDRECSDL